MNLSTMISIVVLVVLIGFGVYGYNRVQFLEAKLDRAEAQLTTAITTINLMSKDIKNIQKNESERSEHTIEYNNTVREIIKENDPVYLNEIKTDPTKYQDKLNIDFNVTFNQFNELSK